ncbi:MAG: hypothetical protein CVT77_09440 [Alphaproteobacteria bacterium HGW-Alphaproteobacteria-16]|nr:MAG: hypothetical protein CVT77_09440 [Alphaproteobacteria bacterium HGW-Alphaproteobacteria-16]
MTTQPIQIESDRNFASGGRLVRQITSIDRAHLAVEFEAGRDAPSTIANSANPDLPLGLYGSPTINPGYGVELYSPAAGQTGKWIDGRVVGMGTNFTVAAVVNVRDAADASPLITNRNSGNYQPGFYFYVSGTSIACNVGCIDRTTLANSLRLTGNLNVATPNAWRLVIMRVSGIVDPVVQISQYRAGGLVGAVLSSTHTGYDRNPDILPLAFGSTRGTVPNTGASANTVDFLAGFAWANQDAVLTDAECTTLYSEVAAHFAARGETV